MICNFFFRIPVYLWIFNKTSMFLVFSPNKNFTNKVHISFHRITNFVLRDAQPNGEITCRPICHPL